MRSLTLRTVCVTAIFAWFSQIRAYVIMEPHNKDARAYLNDYQHRLVSLVQFLENINALSKQETSLRETLSPREPEVQHQDKTEYKDIDGLLESLEKPIARVVDIEKKDYAILPPASEWCRLMGFRGCRGNSA